MGKCVIFCAAGFDSPAEPIEKDDLVIAADGGLRHTQALGIRPQVILGDFDSLGYIPAEAIVHPVEKDDTDAMLAVRLGLERGCREFVIYGGMDGPRTDHLIANLQTLQFLADRNARGILVGERQNATVIRNGSMHLPARQAGTVSVFCSEEKALGVTVRGLKYAMEDGVLTVGFPLGCSNQFVGKAAEISVKSGSLLIVWDRQEREE